MKCKFVLKLKGSLSSAKKISFLGKSSIMLNILKKRTFSLYNFSSALMQSKY